MIKKTLGEIATFVSGGIEERFQDLPICGASIDTRKIIADNLFIPLKGENTDGHQYVMKAFAAGAAASLWEHHIENPPKDVPLIFVDDALSALQLLAKEYLSTLPSVVIGITGSNGKTSTKDLIAAVLSQTFSVHKTEGNYNNHIGLPLTVLMAPQYCEVLILEMGMSSKGEIAFLSKLAQPHITVITNIGESHLLDLGSREAIADAKCEIIEGATGDSVLFYNGDEPLLEERLTPLSQKQSFGVSSKNDFYPEDVSIDTEGTSFTVSEHKLFIPILGEHNIMNALAAIGVAREFNMSWEEIKIGLSKAKLTNMRNELVKGAHGEYILNDAYNASPTSMRAAIKLTQDLKNFNRKFAVLGDMLELGDDEINYHREIGAFLDPNEIDMVYTYGNLGQYIAEGALPHFQTDQVCHFADKNALGEALQSKVQADDLILFKASRGLHFEDVIEKLK